MLIVKQVFEVPMTQGMRYPIYIEKVMEDTRTVFRLKRHKDYIGTPFCLESLKQLHKALGKLIKNV